MNPKVPLAVTIDFIWGYVSQEEPEVRFTIIANLLMRFLNESVPPQDHSAAMQAILDTLPIARLYNAPTPGGMQ